VDVDNVQFSPWKRGSRPARSDRAVASTHRARVSRKKNSPLPAVMIPLLPEEVVRCVALLLLPEEGLSLCRTSRTLHRVVQPLQKVLWRENDGVQVGTSVLYRDFTGATYRRTAGFKPFWPQWASRVGVVTSIEGKVYTIRDEEKGGRLQRASRNVRRCRTFLVDLCIQSVERDGQLEFTCPGCYSRHWHGGLPGWRSPHCVHWKRHWKYNYCLV